MIVKVKRVKEGYLVQTTNVWKGQIPSFNLSHDLYHHNPESEDGSLFLEYQAIGKARYYQNLKFSYGILLLTSEDYNNLENAYNSIKLHSLDIITPDMEIKVRNRDTGEEKFAPDNNFFRKLKQHTYYGYTQAETRNFPLESYNKINNTDFKELHSTREEDLLINLETGEIMFNSV